MHKASDGMRGDAQMTSWSGFAAAAPEFAEAGRRLLVGEDGVSIGFFASVDSALRPHLSPVCPIFCGDDLFLSAAARTPKARDLRERQSYVLHAFLGANDEEFQVAGAAREELSPDRRSAVHEAIPFPAFDKADPIFRLSIERSLWVYWENVGTPKTRPIRRAWQRSGERRE